jgi:hypothetical protein
MTAKATQYTIRNVPPAIDRALRRKAAALRQSLNAVLLRALRAEAGLGETPREHHDLDHYAGTWVADPKVDRALAEQRKIDPRDWA